MPPKKKKPTAKAKKAAAAAATDSEEEDEKKNEEEEATPEEIFFENALAALENEHQPSATVGRVRVVAETNLKLLDMTQFAHQAPFEAKLVAERKEENIRKLAFSPDGKYLAAGYGFDGQDATAKTIVFDTNTVENVKTLGDSFYIPAFSCDSKFLVSRSKDSPTRLMVYSVAEEFKKVAEVKLEGGANVVDLKASPFKPNDFLVAIDQRVSFVSIAAKEVLWYLNLGDLVDRVAFLSRDRVVATIGTRGRFAVIENGAVLKYFEHPSAINVAKLAVFANSPRLASVDRNKLIFWDWQTFKKISSADLSMGQEPFDVQVLPNDRAIVVSSDSTAARGLLFLDCETGEKVDSRILNQDGEEMEKRRGAWMALHPSGNCVALRTGEHQLSFYSLKMPERPRLGRPFMPTQTFKVPITDLEFAEDGMSVVATDVQNQKQTIQVDFGQNNQHLVNARKIATERMGRFRVESELEQEKRLHREERELREESERENEELKRQLAEARIASASSGDGRTPPLRFGGCEDSEGLTAKRRARESEKDEEEERSEEN